MYGFRPDARRCRSSFACTLPPVELAKPLLSLPALLLYRQLPCIGVHMALQQFIGNFGHADTPLRDDRSGGHLTHRFGDESRNLVRHSGTTVSIQEVYGTLECRPRGARRLAAGAYRVEKAVPGTRIKVKFVDLAPRKPFG